MTRDLGLEELIREHLGDEPGLGEVSMFGGRAWLRYGNLLCAARHDGLLVRLGKGSDGWALALPGVEAIMSGSRPMTGWVRAGPEVYGDDGLRRKLLDAALVKVRAMPPKAVEA